MNDWQRDDAKAVEVTSSRHDRHDDDILRGINACLGSTPMEAVGTIRSDGPLIRGVPSEPVQNRSAHIEAALSAICASEDHDVVHVCLIDVVRRETKSQ